MPIHNEFLASYLRLVEDTESPRLFHTWSALSGISACMGRRVFLPFGFNNIYANQYVLLVGPPAVKKSTALNIMKDMLEQVTNVKMAPDDTGGQRQGLLAAMQPKEETEEDKQLSEALKQQEEEGLLDMNSLLETSVSFDVDLRDPYSMYILQSEFQALIGQNNQDILTFLIKLYDGESYRYRLKSSNMMIKDAVVNILGGTTPSSLASSLPQEAIGHGFTSRVIFVYGDQKYKKVPRLKPFDAELHGLIKAVYSEIFHNFQGPMTEHPDAANLLDEIYGQIHIVDDPRFIHYSERRQTHLMKLSMVIAASNLRMTIMPDDVELADQLLSETEIHMPDALGEFGLNKSSVAKQKLLEYLRQIPEPVPIASLYTWFNKDMTGADFKSAINEFNNAGKIGIVKVPSLGDCVIAAAQEEKNKKADLFKQLLGAKHDQG